MLDDQPPDLPVRLHHGRVYRAIGRRPRRLQDCPDIAVKTLRDKSEGALLPRHHAPSTSNIFNALYFRPRCGTGYPNTATSSATTCTVPSSSVVSSIGGNAGLTGHFNCSRGDVPGREWSPCAPQDRRRRVKKRPLWSTCRHIVSLRHVYRSPKRSDLMGSEKTGLTPLPRTRQQTLLLPIQWKERACFRTRPSSHGSLRNRRSRR